MGRTPENTYKITLSIRLPLPFLAKLDDFQNRWNCKDRSTAIAKLIDVALFMEQKVQEAEEWKPEDMDEIKKQFDEGALVDWIQKMDPKRLQIMADIFRVETDARQKQKKLPQYIELGGRT